ncbi:Ig-like domain-containing protein [Methanobrevibacter sp.]|uniref:Ig-like domain-containing protein n=1 Tax=Methanobrevibacter sp. TaxID=66852 RepID=UPI0038907C7B
MKIINTCLMAFLILLLGIGFVSAAEDGINSNIDATVSDVAEVEGISANGADDVLNAVDDEEVIGEVKSHVEVNSYDLADLNPHSVNINNDSDYVAYVYAPNESGGSVSVVIGEDDDAVEIFNKDIQSLDKKADENDKEYSYFFIRPTDISYSIAPDLYYVTVVYKYGLTLSETNDGLVRFVENADHVTVDVPPQIVIGDAFDRFMSIHVEGTLGNLRVLIDGKEIMNGPVFDLKYDEESNELKQVILVDLNDLSIGQHTYEVSYYDGNWEDVTFSDKFNVTYLFDVAVGADNVYYGDEVNFTVALPKDASSNEIKVNNEIHSIDLENGLASLTLSDFNLGENVLNFTYNDVKYGEKTFQMELIVNPAIYVPSSVRYGSDEKIRVDFPSDAQGKLRIFLDNIIIADLDAADSVVTYSLDSLQVGSHKVALLYDDEKYYVNKEVTIDVIPNVEFKNVLTIGEDAFISVDVGAEGNVTVFCNGQNISTEKLVNGKMSISIPSSSLHLGENIITLKYDGDEFDKDPFYYYDNETGENVAYQYKVTVGPNDLEIPDEFSQDGEGNIILGLPEGFDGNVKVYVNKKLLSTNAVLGGINNIPVSGLNPQSNNVSVVLTDSAGNSFETNKEVYVPKIEPQVDIVSPVVSTVPTFTIVMPDDATGRILVILNNYSTVEDAENGNITVTIPGLEDGVYNSTILYEGDSKYSSFIKNVIITIRTVELKNPQLKISVPSNYLGQKSVITVTTNSAFTGIVKVKIKSTTYSVSVVNGKGTKSISGLKVGTYSAVATFAANSVFKSDTKSVSFKVNENVKLTLGAVTVKKSAKKLVIKASLKINGKIAKSKTIKFKFNNKIYKAKTNKKGVASITIKSSILNKLKVGKNIKYSATYSKKTVQKTVKVKK